MTNPFGVNDETNEGVGVNEGVDMNENPETNTDSTALNPDAEIKADVSGAEQSDTEADDADLQKKFEVLNSQYIRLAADFDNYRKRQAQERESLLKYGAENTLKKIIEVLDNFERGAKANETIDDCEKLKESFNLVHKQLLDVLSKVGLETIEAEGKEFDPNFHEAVMQTPTGEYPEHTIIAELQKGYKLGDRVLRPSLVNVATSEG